MTEDARRRHLPELEASLRRQDRPRQPLLHHSGLIQRPSQRFEDGFHDVMGIASILEINVKIQATVGYERLKKSSNKPKSNVLIFRSGKCTLYTKYGRPLRSTVT